MKVSDTARRFMFFKAAKTIRLCAAFAVSKNITLASFEWYRFSSALARYKKVTFCFMLVVHLVLYIMFLSRERIQCTLYLI